MLVNRVSSTLLSTAGAAGTGPGRLAIAVVGMQSGVLSGILLASHQEASSLFAWELHHFLLESVLPSHRKRKALSLPTGKLPPFHPTFDKLHPFPLGSLFPFHREAPSPRTRKLVSFPPGTLLHSTGRFHHFPGRETSSLPREILTNRFSEKN